MLRLMVPVLLLGGALAFRPQPLQSAASEAQIRFAVENKYDNTGPGAKERQFAYNAYKSVEDALIAFLDDPDTKLPDFERERAIKKLTEQLPNENGEYGQPIKRFYPKTVAEYTGFDKQNKDTILLSKIEPTKHYQLFALHGSKIKKLQGAQPYRVTKLPVRYPGSAYYSDDTTDEKDPYTFRDHEQHEVPPPSREQPSGALSGYYTFQDPDGSRHTVYYSGAPREERTNFDAALQSYGFDQHY